MARIRSLDKGTQSITAHTSLVDCFHSTVLDADGELLLHLSTFGSDQRKSKPKSSQSIQIDAAMAAQLLEVIYEAFPALSQKTGGAHPIPSGSGEAGDSPIYHQLAEQYGAAD
ncbi:hypothetical protein [Rhodococcus sp. NPDC004095]